jgi:hypothetical protein
VLQALRGLGEMEAACASGVGVLACLARLYSPDAGAGCGDGPFAPGGLPHAWEASDQCFFGDCDGNAAPLAETRGGRDGLASWPSPDEISPSEVDGVDLAARALAPGALNAEAGALEARRVHRWLARRVAASVGEFARFLQETGCLPAAPNLAAFVPPPRLDADAHARTHVPRRDALRGRAAQRSMLACGWTGVCE